jgi:peptidoglycan hydrolase-like protein with peptidoglycan-binding domain
LGLGAERCAGHKEYALPHGRKTDPTLDMPSFRDAVAKLLIGATPPSTLIPSIEPSGPNAPAGRPTVRRGMSGDAVREVQRVLGLPVTGNFDAVTEARVRDFQRSNQLVPDGIIGPKSWAAVDVIARAA